MVRIIDLSASRKIPCMKILSDDEEDSNPGMVFTFQRFADAYFGANAPGKVDPPHLMDWTIEQSIVQKGKREAPIILKIKSQVAVSPSKEKLGLNVVFCDDGPCALPLDNMSSILEPASYDLPLITWKDLDRNPQLKESSAGHYEGKQQDAYQTKKASCHATFEMSAFCGNDFMIDCHHKVSVMAWKGLRVKIVELPHHKFLLLLNKVI
ncbi:hypothetical protein JCGZ_10402 [Jatropha curcas]|uniref:Uncharacterized protein n=1 Tax=Jatropha curcas TaxID=180498 RepID=A0A067LEL1_JATCU|nr:hypothetical protein JCGZ_10402 [Jatropha curcas]